MFRGCKALDCPHQRLMRICDEPAREVLEAVENENAIRAELQVGKVDEVGFVDLMPGSGHGLGGWINVAGFEVYGKPVKR